MPRFICLQRSLPSPEQASPSAAPSPSEMQEMYARFGAWQARFAEQIVDMGGKLGEGRLVTVPSADGPFVELKELVGGYMIVQADDLDAAIAVATACPGLVRPGSGVEVLAIHGP
jgi:hypothetical protein